MDASLLAMDCSPCHRPTSANCSALRRPRFSSPSSTPVNRCRRACYESAQNCDFAVYVYAGPRGQAQPTPDKPASRQLACPPEGPGETLSPIDRDILEALRNSTLTARTLANKAGYRFNSYFRAFLSGLVRRGYLVVTTQGYCRAPSVQDGS